MKQQKQDEYIKISVSKLIPLVIGLVLLASLPILLYFGGPFLAKQPFFKSTQTRLVIALHDTPVIGQYIPARMLPTDYILTQVFPQEGFQTNIRFGDIVPKMVAAGIIDKGKLEELYKGKEGKDSIPKDMRLLLEKPSRSTITITKDNSSWLINFLWPLGLANKMTINEQSPIAGKNVNYFASTGGWTLGKEDSGGVYFNSTELIKLNKSQEQRVKRIAETIYRPCCNNSSFFQDCNHGSAALAVIMLGVSQGLSDDEIYTTVLHFNSFWFPQNYTKTALYFQYEKNTEWHEVEPKTILSKEYSSITGWLSTVDSFIQKRPDLLPASTNGPGCSV